MPCIQQASYLEEGPLMWILPLYLHVNKKSDGDDAIFNDQNFNGKLTTLLVLNNWAQVYSDNTVLMCSQMYLIEINVYQNTCLFYQCNLYT